jgi:hypothetical protein
MPLLPRTYLCSTGPTQPSSAWLQGVRHWAQAAGQGIMHSGRRCRLAAHTPVQASQPGGWMWGPCMPHGSPLLESMPTVVP